MTLENYLELFQSIVKNENPTAPYDNKEYMEYTKMNEARTNRWLKTFVVDEEVKQTIQAIKYCQNWILITEPWCGDAAHVVPIVGKLAKLNTNIQLTITLRDSEPFMIEQYLTNGAKSIPILIIRDSENKDLAVWGPRPQGAQELFKRLKQEEAPFEEVKIGLQKWYNDNRGVQIAEEISQLIK